MYAIAGTILYLRESAWTRSGGKESRELAKSGYLTEVRELEMAR
jgi:hypothetical protein